ncbi:glycosyltransferase family 2 protein [Streptomyces sp. NBC_00335]|uniref:glycosyltransferase family 2 protein n=1 Tax=unclassified Streptomyces TaxID=2593676 RepID=UPI002251A4D6|nr:MULTISPECIES: glycosyltransferase family 2 protein [unclassified Streptomyces]MCX5405694.1 glycosyltransferase family 2 protein [Streptomyces sp. NBC_00086]
MSGESAVSAGQEKQAPTTPAGERWLGAVGLSVVIPAPVPEQNLTALREHLDAHCGTGPGAWELIVVTGDAVAPTPAAAAEPRIRLIRPDGDGDGDYSAGSGKGAALRAGVLASTGERVLLTDAALSTPLEELARLEEVLDANAGADLNPAPDPGTHDDAPPAVVLGRSRSRLVRTLGIPGIPGFRADTCAFALFDGDRARAAFGASTLDGPAIDAEVLRWVRRQGWPVAEVELPVHRGRTRNAPTPAPTPAPRPDRRRALGDLFRLNAGGLTVAGAFLLLSLYVFQGLWTDLDGAYLADALQDQNQWEWFVGVTTDNITHLRNPLFTLSQGMPDGVNLMANATMLGLNVPLIPVTLLFGETVTFALVLTLGMAASAWTWYWLIRCRFVRSRWAAAAGGALAAFAPPMVSHANGHPNFVVLFMIPLIIDRALRLCEGHREGPRAGRSVTRDGVLLGLFATYQIFIGEEPLLIAALGMLVFCLAYLLVAPRRALAAARPLGSGLVVALAVCLPLVAVPLYWQFFGPQSYHSVLHGDNAGNSPRALIEYASRSLFGDPETAGKLSLNTTEQNAFYGWPLLAFGVVVCVWLWRSKAVRALALTGFTALLLSLGPWVPVPRTEIVLPGPWRLMIKLPLFESVIEGRVAMVCAPILGILLALALDRIIRLPERELRTLGLLGAAAALIPVLPLPLTVRDRAPVPAFITSGDWKGYVKDGEALVPVPLPDPGQADALHWQVEADFGFRLAGGYFNGPWGPDRIGIYGATPRHLSNLLRDVRYGAQPPEVDAGWRTQARQDLEFWKAGAVVLPFQDRDGELRGLITGLLGREPEQVRDVWVWRVGPGEP